MFTLQVLNRSEEKIRFIKNDSCDFVIFFLIIYRNVSPSYSSQPYTEYPVDLLSLKKGCV